ncbi:MAG: nucleotidyl transferase AbiEii/AbiGii toxin family protein [Candidatus Kerfeldbacteria bacterium]|nr:nucleotidyl transferase AbiEii/AbiGii toxin family protein [Candidatus Kerfeldbacteria bacterium]
MHKEILTKEQNDLLPLVKEFSNDFILVGGTAMALHIGHRRSIDFDLFSYGEFNNVKIKRKIFRYHKIDKTYINETGEYTFLINNVKMTFYNFPHKIKASARLDKIIRLPDLITLAAMKALALGHRGKWKDYVDLYFILKNYYSLDEISRKGGEVFGGGFNERIFREALAYFDDINYSEEVIYMKGYEISDAKIKKSLVDFSLK